MQAKKIAYLILTASALAILGCRNEPNQSQSQTVSSLKDVPAVRLNYRYEPDVPAPGETSRAAIDDRNAAVQADFDQNRAQELLDKTVLSPDGKRILAVYHKPTDLQSEFRLDMYSQDGKLLRKITADMMAVHFPDTILWSPDSSTVAFVAMLRGASMEPGETPIGNNAVEPTPNPEVKPSQDANTNKNAEDQETSSEVNANTATVVPTPVPPANVLTFRTEQIYTCNADGDGIKALTQNEGLIYFYYVWSPDSSMLAALAATGREWQYLQYRADEKGEIFIPVGRPRLVEKTGRERRLDDALTPVQPVWSPDSAKVACAFDKQVRIYDADGNAPTQAAIPLRNNLLLSSKVFDDEQQTKLNAANVAPDANTQVNSPGNSNAAPTMLPDENTLVSFNPIVALNWPSEEQLYFQTAFVKRMKNEADSVTSFPRWHRLILTPQATVLNK
jgi:Tol biopolymer transport system component